MSNFDDILNHIVENYETLEPIFLEDLPFEKDSISNFSKNIKEIESFISENFEQANVSDKNKSFFPSSHLSKVVHFNDEILVRPPSNGFILKKPIFSMEKAVERTFIKNKKGERIGFYTGNMLLNQIGFSTQVPSYFIIKTNNFPNDAIEGKPYLFLDNIKCIFYKSEAVISNENWKEEQYKDLLSLVGVKEMIKKRDSFKMYSSYYLSVTEENYLFNKFCS